MTGWAKKYAERLVAAAAWISGLSTFILLGSMVLLGGLVADPRHFNRFVKTSCRAIVRMSFIRVRVQGRNHVHKRRTYLFMSNHVNIFDVFILYGYIPNFCRAVELDQHFRWPLYGALIRRLGMIPISHTRGRAALQSLEKARAVLAAGDSILILPEGGRTLDGQLKPFKRGTFMLAKEAGADIVPMAMVGAFKINRKGSLMIRPGRVTLRFGEPIAYTRFKKKPVEEIRSMMQEKIGELLTG